jgi:hypothetical protein
LLVLLIASTVVSSMPTRGKNKGFKKGENGRTLVAVPSEGGNDALEGLPKAVGLEEISMDISEDVIDFDTSAVIRCFY